MAGIYLNPSITEPNKPYKIREVKPEILKARFLAMYKEVGNIKIACQILGIIYHNIWAWKERDPEFKKAVAEAKDAYLGILEDEAHRRAVMGVEKTVYQGGKPVGTVREYSDTLLQTLLKGAAPYKYGNKVELSGPDGGPIQNKVVHVHSSVPLAESEEDVQKTIDLSADEVQVLSSVPNASNLPVSIPIQALTQEDLDLLG